MNEHKILLKQYQEVDLPNYEKDMGEWKRTKHDAGPPPVKPLEPVAWRAVVDDTTLEAVAALLSDQPRGLVLAADELSGWLGGFDKYRAKGGGGDAARWLEVHGGRTLAVDRKTGTPRTLYVPNASVSVVGGIQPEVLLSCLSPQFRANGMSARILMCWPPRKCKRWTDAEIDPAAESAVQRIVERLLTLEMETDDAGDFVPGLVDLDVDARKEFIQFYDRAAAEQSEMTGELCATWSKLEGYAPRLALVVHLVRWANGDIHPDFENLVDVESMRAGIAMVDWFGSEAKRVHGLSLESDTDRESRNLTEWIAARDGSATVRELMRHRSAYKSASSARDALQQLVRAGLGRWDSSSDAEKFVLSTTDTDTTSIFQLENVGSVNGDYENPYSGERFFTEEDYRQVDSL